MSTTQKMKVEIWSDIMCPFCYIGKRHFEAALGQFDERDSIDIEWHSFQLDPSIPVQTEKLNVYQYLADRKGISYEQSVDMHKNVLEMAKRAGLNYNFDIAVVANSFDAHRLIQLAKLHQLDNEMEEHLFQAYFTEGKNLNDQNVLVELGKDIGLDEKEIKQALHSDELAYAVKQDIQEAESIGVRGVPFFVFNRKYAVSGAQPAQVFLDTLQKSVSDWQKAKPLVAVDIKDGPSCSPEDGYN